MSEPLVLRVNYGSDLEVDLPWPNGEGGNADLTGWTIEPFDVDERLDGLVSTAAADPSTGVVRFAVQWADGHRKGAPLRSRVRVSRGGQDATSNEIWVIYE